MNTIQLSNVRYIHPLQQCDEITDVYLQNGKIISLDQLEKNTTKPIPSIDATGKWLIPTIFDLCANLREPGQQQHGTLQSEGYAAKQNGILHVVAPPDRKQPIQDNGALIQGLQEKAYKDGGIYLYIIGAQTQGLLGKQPANMAGLKKGGCIAVSNAYAPFADDDVIIRTLEYAAGLDLTVVFYPEEPQIAKDGCVHEGFIASRQGLPMIPAIAETVAIAKYIQMIEATGVKAHFGLLSCGASVELIANAKAKGLPITADVAIHQLHLTEEMIDGFNALAHVRPPLRSQQDRDLLREGLKTGIIDAICSHHEPLNASAKMAPFADTQAGLTAFDSFIPLGIKLINEGVLTPLQWVNCISLNPAKIFHQTEIWQQQAGWVLIDPQQQWQLQTQTILSNGKNTPLLGQTMTGKVEQIFIA